MAAYKALAADADGAWVHHLTVCHLDVDLADLAASLGRKSLASFQEPAEADIQIQAITDLRKSYEWLLIKRVVHTTD